MTEQPKQDMLPNQSQKSVGLNLSVNQSMLQSQDDDISKINISNIILNAPLSNLNEFYDLESSLFKKRIEKLNLKFYWETENLNTQKSIPNPYNKLFLILFKEINLYTDEIVRLNNIIKDKVNIEKTYKNKIFEFSQKEKERLLTKQMLKNYQKTNKVLEKKLNEKNKNEEKLKADIKKLKNKQIQKNNSTLLNSISTPNESTISACNSQVYQSNITIKQSSLNNSIKSNIRASHSIENKYKKKNNFGCLTTPNIKNGHKNNSIDQKPKNLLKNNNTIQTASFINSSTDNIGILTTNKNGEDILYCEDDIINEFNDDIINSCMNHFDSEMELLNGIEDFLERKKKDIRDTFTKANFTSLKNTLRKIS